MGVPSGLRQGPAHHRKVLRANGGKYFVSEGLFLSFIPFQRLLRDGYLPHTTGDLVQWIFKGFGLGTAIFEGFVFHQAVCAKEIGRQFVDLAVTELRGGVLISSKLHQFGK